jgi:hypothetical protein
VGKARTARSFSRAQREELIRCSIRTPSARHPRLHRTRANTFNARASDSCRKRRTLVESAAFKLRRERRHSLMKRFHVLSCECGSRLLGVSVPKQKTDGGNSFESLGKSVLDPHASQGIGAGKSIQPLSLNKEKQRSSCRSSPLQRKLRSSEAVCKRKARLVLQVRHLHPNEKLAE